MTGWCTTASWCLGECLAGGVTGGQVGDRTVAELGPCAVFLWDPEKEVGFVYIPTYLAWWVLYYY